MGTQRPKIASEEIIRDIRDGRGYGELMEKYRLTENQLERIIRRLVNLGMITETETSTVKRPRRKVNASHIVKDLRSGMSDEDLMVKYGINNQQLEKILGKIVDAGMMSDMELFERSTISESAVTKCFVETQQSILELGLDSSVPPAQESATDESVEITEVLPLPGSFLKDALSRFRE